MVNRFINDKIMNSSKSCLLLGPRQVGKSTLINQLNPDLSINLADEFEYLNYSTDLQKLEKLIQLNKPKTIFIDEIQRLPSLLNTIQFLVDKDKKLKFYLTGSSARKLKRGKANLLPGRLLDFKMGPLTASELGSEFNIKKALSIGLLPEIYLNSNKNDTFKLLKAYSAIYLKEEIKAEALTRNLESFARFLIESVQSVGQFVDFTKLAKKAKISRHAIPRYFEILEDTLIGYRVFSFSEMQDQFDLIKHPRFYFFDVGVYNGLLGNFEPSLDRVGVLSEQLVFNQLMHSAWSKDEDIEINTFRQRQGVEVDFIIKYKNIYSAIEVKNSDRIQVEDLEGLLFVKKNISLVKNLFLFHMGSKEIKMGPVWCLPLKKGLDSLGL